MSNVVIGRMPFTLGVALAVGAWACARPLARRRPRCCRSPASGRARWPACSSSSPPSPCSPARGRAATAGAGADWRTAARARRRRPSRAGSRWPLLFPEGGSDHFVGTAFWPMLLVCLGARWRSSTRAAAPRCGPAGSTSRCSSPPSRSPTRSARTRCAPALVLGPALLVLFARPRAPRARGRRGRGVLLLPAVAARRARRRGGARRPVDRRPPSTREVLRLPRRARASPGERLEVPLTRNHWEATYLARRTIPLARGWHRQLDRKVNPLFYDPAPAHAGALRGAGCATTPCAGSRCPTAPLDFSRAGRAPAARARRRRSSSPCTRSPRLADLGGARRASRPSRARAQLTAAGADGFDLEASRPGRVLVRQHGTPYWTVDGGRRLRDADRARAGRSSTSAGRARCGCGRASRRAARCGASRAAATADDGPAAAVRQPPVSGTADRR